MSDKQAQVVMVSLELLKPWKKNTRIYFDEAKLKELSETIKNQGIFQPILVRADGSNYEIIAGERRYRAAKIAGLKEVPVMIRELTDQEVLEINIIENVQREGLHELEEAAGYKELMKLPGYDVEKVAARVGRSTKYVYDRIKLLQLIEPIKKDFLKGKIAAGHAILLARLSPKDQQYVLDNGLYEDENVSFDNLVENSDCEKPISVRELQELIDEHVRFVPERDADPMLFPETSAVLKSADSKKKSDKIVHLATGYVQDSARNGQKHIPPTSWERADGKEGSKTCEFSVIGVVISGEERAKAFRVCTAKDKCMVHWSARIKARGQSNKVGSGKQEQSMAEQQRKEKERQEVERQRRDEVEKCWKFSLPKIVGALAVAIKKAPAGSKSALGEILKDATNYSSQAKTEKLIPLGSSSEDLVRHLAFRELFDMAEERWQRETFIKKAKILGVDVKKILEQANPEKKPSEVKPKTKK